MPLPLTEQSADLGPAIDLLAPQEALALILSAQSAALAALTAVLPELQAGAERIAETLALGGTLTYVAAGSSGLMALADASELPGTFGIAQDQIRILMAGGVPVDAIMPACTEDDIDAARRAASPIQTGDLVIALSASGRTPYSCEIARLARQRGAAVIAIANNPGTELLALADVAICLATPPEVLAGSTRLGAGTAQKVALNMMSTLAGILLGHVHDGLMVNVIADNIKLRQRANNMVQQIANCTARAARDALQQADGNTKLACLIALGQNPAGARTTLVQNNNNLRQAVIAHQREVTG
jgi:N-acetylmuramic acid 6-phosphate etherase